MSESVMVHRDEWGIPHVVATTETGVCYGLGWAQAEDRLEELLRNYRRAAGTMAEAFGEEWVEHDWQQRLVGHERVCRRRYPELPDGARAMIEAFQQGVRGYMAAHPDQVPDWAPPIEPWQVVALGRHIIFNWPMGAARAKLERRDETELQFFSNQWTVRPERTATDCAILCIDPHIPWHGAFRFYEFRAHGGRYNVSGFGPLGSPFVGLGHNEFLGWACTTGGPSTTDIYVEDVNPENPLQYRYDNDWRTMSILEIRIPVKGGDTVVRELHSSHHGPIILRDGNRAYAVATPYLDEVGSAAQFYHMCLSRNLAEFRTAAAMCQLMEQNLMCADVEGNIAYVRTGRVPIRPEGFDFSKPVPGNTSRSEWRGLHGMEDLVQLTNPPQGYMQNCNCGPDVMMVDSPLTPDRYPGYIFNSAPGRSNSRSRRAVELLHAETAMNLAKATAIAMDTHADGAERWQAAVAAAAKSFDGHPELEAIRPALKLLAAWDGHMRADSSGATLYRALREFAKQEPPVAADAIRDGRPLSRGQQEQLLRALGTGARHLATAYGRLDVPWGQVHRIRRGDQSWPAAGGDSGGGQALRAISADMEDGVYVGRAGQSWVQIVLLRPGAVESYSVTPFGQSDHPDSPHYTDQAERLFSKGLLKPTWFHLKDLEGHVVRTTELQAPANALEE